MKYQKMTALVLLCASMVTPVFATSYGPAYPNTSETVGITEITDSPVPLAFDTVSKIEYIYANETNENLKRISIDTMKACVYPENYYNYSNCVLIGNVPYNESFQYSLSSIGLDSSWPRYSVDNSGLMILGKIESNEDKIRHIKEIDDIYNYCIQVKQETEGLTDEQKIAKIQDILMKRLEYDYNQDFLYKPADVLNNGRGVCTGYSTLFYLGCINSGLRCECVGNHEHMWNRVLLNNEWKHIDVTWNDARNGNVWYLQNENELDNQHILLNCFRTN